MPRATPHGSRRRRLDVEAFGNHGGEAGTAAAGFEVPHRRLERGPREGIAADPEPEQLVGFLGRGDLAACQPRNQHLAEERPGTGQGLLRIERKLEGRGLPIPDVSFAVVQRNDE